MPSSKPVTLSPAQIEAMAWDYDVPLTVTADRAFVTVHGVTFTAPLEPPSRGRVLAEQHIAEAKAAAGIGGDR